MKIKKKYPGEGGGGGGGGWVVGGRVGDQGECERRIEVFCENSNNSKKKSAGRSSRGRVGGGGQVGCERRIEVL